MAKPEFLQLAHPFKVSKHLAAGAFVSEKLDGFRCFWDGGVSRGMSKSDVPWANLDKDERYKEVQVATGLWTRYGNVVHAPDYWIDKLPPFMCDGELWAGRGSFQQLRKIASRLPSNRIDTDWRDIQYKIFDIPSAEAVFGGRKINDTNFKKIIPESTLDWVRQSKVVFPRAKTFRGVLAYLEKNLPETDSVQLLQQTQLPFSTERALERVHDLLDDVTTAGGEGLILRRPDSIWTPERTHNLMKVKTYDDSEGTVVGYVTGRKTDKGSKLLGLMGALLIDWNGTRFELSGFTDAERVFGSNSDQVHVQEVRTDWEGIKPKDFYVDRESFLWAMANPSPDNGPGTEVPDWINNPMFPRGSQVTFRYRELSDDGIPKEARYWRS